MLLFGIFLAIIATGLPVAFAFGTAGLIFILSATKLPPQIISTVSFASLDSFPLMAVPFFIFAGDIMRYGGVSKRLVAFAKSFCKDSASALGTITIVGCAFFGAISGAAVATVAAIGGIMIPEMVKGGYKKEYAVALACASGYLGILIPPSIPLVVYGVTANASIGDLFMAGVVPGVLAAIAFIVYNKIACKKMVTVPAATEELKKETFWQSFVNVIPGLLMPVIILGGIYGGIFTATEAAAVAIFYGLVVSLWVYKEIKIKDILKIATESAYSSAKILFIIGLAGFFSRLMTVSHMPQDIANALLGITTNKIAMLLLINVLYLLLGMVMETSCAILITTPILLPIVTGMGVDPVHFGVMMVFNLAVGLITPPMAVNLFVGSQLSNTPITKLVRPIIPFVLVSIIVLLLVAYVPAISLTLPHLVR